MSEGGSGTLGNGVKTYGVKTITESKPSSHPSLFGPVKITGQGPRATLGYLRVYRHREKKMSPGKVYVRLKSRSGVGWSY